MAARASDAETRADRDDHTAIRLWLRMLATNRRVLRLRAGARFKCP